MCLVKKIFIGWGLLAALGSPQVYSEEANGRVSVLWVEAINGSATASFDLYPEVEYCSSFSFSLDQASQPFYQQLLAAWTARKTVAISYTRAPFLCEVSRVKLL